MKDMIEDIKLNKVAYLLEIIEKKDFESKLKAYKKIAKMNITKNIGLFIISSLNKDFGLNDDNGGINASLLELCFKNYYDEYTKEIKKLYSKANDNFKNKIVYLLSTIDNGSSLDLYADIILKDYKDKSFIPVSNLFERPQCYTYLFPKLYKALKSKTARNNILILLNDYLNAGVVEKNDLKKNKKLVTDALCQVFDEALKLKFKNTFEAFNNETYKDLRFFLEICINIEVYVSNKKTSDYLDKLYKKNDNQLKLFILDNYYRKGLDISKYNVTSIAKDPASRYALFELYNLYDKVDLFPKKYFTKELIAESDFYTNFVIFNAYKYEPKTIKFIKKVTINDFDYYVFKFKCTYKYDSTSKDFLTNYICNVVGIEKYNGKNITDEFIGISGGYNKDKKITLVEKKHTDILFSKIDKDSNIDEIIDKLIPKEEKIEEVQVKKERHVFSYILLTLLFIFTSMLIFMMLYVNNVANINEAFKKNTLKAVEIKKEYTFTEINGDQIFNMPEAEYYVLLYKKDKDKNIYFNYINEYLKRGKKYYYVNLNDEKNKFLYEANGLNFTLTDERLLKVRDKEYEYFIDGKSNILEEMKNEINKYIEAEKIEKTEKAKAAQNVQNK